MNSKNYFLSAFGEYPHGKQPDIAFYEELYYPEGVNFGSSTGKSGPVKFIFVLITDNGNYSEYLSEMS